MDKRYLIEVLLRARENITQVAQRAAAALDNVTRAQDRGTEASRKASSATQQQVTQLERLREARIREKRGLDESAAAHRQQAQAMRDTAASYREQARNVRASADALRAQRNEAVRAQNEALNEATALRDLARARQDQIGAIDKTVRQLTQQAEASRRIADQNRRLASSYDQSVRAIEKRADSMDRDAVAAERNVRSQENAARSQQRASSTVGRAIEDVSRRIERLGTSQDSSTQHTGRFTRALERMGISTQSARSGLRGLNAEFQGFQIALAIKYAQSLISALIALAAQFVAVAAAAGQAAIGIGAAFGAAAAQALPVVGVMAASFARLAAVLQAVKLSNQQQLTATHDSAAASRRQRDASEQIRAAQERVADAHRTVRRAVRDLAQTQADAAREEVRARQDVTRAQEEAARNVVRAQREVTQARRDAIRTVQDLIAAEEAARLAAEGADQSVLESQARLRAAVRGGDVAGAVSAEIGVRQARFDQRQARIGLGRARQDAAPARAQGVEGVQAVQQAEQHLAEVRRDDARQVQDAEQRLGDVRRTNVRQVADAERRITDARRDESRATADLARTRRTAAENLTQETAAADKLADTLRRLSPAERELYRRVLALQATYRRVARPITDIITRAFTDVVNRVNQLLQDPRIIRGFRNIAVQIAASIRTATREGGGRESVGAFEILSAEAARNIPIATRILVNFFRAARNLVLDALPAFRLLLTYVEGYSDRALDASRNSRGIRDFFVTGVRYARSFFELGLAVVRLLLTIAGRGGAAAEGIRTIDDLTTAVDGLTRKARRNAGAIREFFSQTHDAFFAVLGVVANLAQTIAGAFSLRSVQTFADFLNRVIIPAIGNVIEIMGFLVNAFHQVFSLPGVAQVAQVAATMLILARGLTIIRTAIGSVAAIMPNFLRAMGLMRAGFAGIAAVTPAGWVVLAIMAVVAAVILLDKKLHFLAPTWRWIKRAAENAWEGIKNAADSVLRWVSDVWTQGFLYWIRWPFVWLERHAGRQLFGWLVNAARDVIGWFERTFGRGGRFSVVGDLILAPFRAARHGVRLAFRFMTTVVEAFLDVLAGRFGSAGDTIKDFFNDVLDTLAGGVTSLFDILEKVLGAMGKVPKIGGPFKDAADDIHKARRSLDDWRESLRDSTAKQKRSKETIDDSLPTLVLLRKRYEVAHDRLKKLTPGTDDYRQAVRRAKEASKDYNDKLKDTASKAEGARPSVRRLRSNIKGLGDVTGDTADTVAKNLNDVLRQVGARTIRLNTRAYRHSGIDVITEATGHAATGGVLSRSSGLRRRLWGGGMANPYGGAADDHVLFSPSGRPVAALSGTEGIVNRPQMGVIDGALSFAQQMGGLPWGSLNELWGSGMRHFQAGGGLKPAISRLSSRLDRMFGLQTTSGYRSNMPLGHPDYHNVGLAADISGPASAMNRAVRFIQSSGIWRGLLEGIHNPGLSIKNGRRVPPSFWGASTWGDHLDHIHLATRTLAAMVAGTVRRPRITGNTDNALGRIAIGSSRVLTRAANRYLRRQMALLGGADTQAMGADANVIRAFRRAIRVSRANRTEQLALWEAGIVESGLRNLHYGDRDSLGSLQERASIFGRSHALNPFASATRFLQDARGRRPWRGSAGMLAQAVQRSGFPGRYDQVAARAQRYLQTGGPVRGSYASRSPAAAFIPRGSAQVGAALRRATAQVNELLDDVAKTLRAVSTRNLRRSKRLALRIQRAFTALTEDGGVLDQIHAAVEGIATRGARRLQRAQFRVTRAGPQRVAMSDADLAAVSLQTLRSTGRALGDERDEIQRGIDRAQASLRAARRRHDAKARAAAEAALANLRARLDQNTTDLAQNAQDQVEAIEAFQQALVSEVNDQAERQNSALDRWQRIFKAMGQVVDPNVVINGQILNMRNQIAGLQGVLDQARRSGNAALATQIQEQIAELNVQIAEAVAQQFANAIDAVNNQAQAQTTRIDRAARRAQIGQVDYAALGVTLQARQQVLANQRAGLAALLAQAAAAGNVEQVENLTDQIDELNTQLAENTQAIQDNTDAAFNARTQQINDAQSFSQTVFGGAQSFFQALAQRTGLDTTAQQAGALRGIGEALATQQGGLKGQLATLLGYTPQEAAQLANLTGADLVNYLTSITSGPALDAILARLDPTQQQAFKDLIGSLIENATAVEQNTQALNDIVAPTAQSFSSTLWTAFRRAVFTGAGGLLPQYAMTIPTADVGARVSSSGALIVHAGETVRPAGVTRDWGDHGGDTYQLNVTTPTEVLDPVDVGRQLAFYRMAQGRR